MRNSLISLISLVFLCYSSLSFSCAPYCGFVSQCNSLQISAYSLRDSQDHVNFCRVQFVNAANRINEACTALSQGRLANAKDTLTSAIGFAESASGKRARCKPKAETTQLINNLTYFRNSIPS